MTIKVRFAPSPTGFLHVGNIRVAIINFLYAKKNNGQFLLRYDDTDSQRVRDEYSKMIAKDMAWLGLEYDDFFRQSSRLNRYEEAKNLLIKKGRLYECFETPEELNLQRKSQIISGIAPVYDRSALRLSSEQKQILRNQGLKPHYRFLLLDGEVSWQDKIKGKITYQGRHFSDPVLIREEDGNGFGIPTYTFCSVVDDIDYKITDIIRGEDHITNTAIQIQIFEALGALPPDFAHLSLIKASEGKISKREGGFDIKSLREEGYEAMSIVNLLSQIGTSQSLKIYTDYAELINNFSFDKFSKSATNYDISELLNINQKLLQTYEFNEINDILKRENKTISQKLWNSIKANIIFLKEIDEWVEICSDNFKYENNQKDKEFLNQCLEVLPADTGNENSWNIWLDNIKKISDRKGKDLFMPIRLALSGREHGPELKNLVNLISREQIIRRLNF